MDSFFVYYLQLLFSLLNNPLFAPCIIQELKNPVSPLTLYLLHSSKNPVSRLRIYSGSCCTFVKVSPGRACIYYNFTFLCWCGMTNLSATFLFPKLLLCHWQITLFSFWKHSVVIVETFKVKVYLAVPRHFPAQPFCPVLVLAFAWQLFSSLHLRLAPFFGSLTVLQLQYWFLKFWKSTVLDSAKSFGQICFFCYIALSILSLRLHLKERVVAL